MLYQSAFEVIAKIYVTDHYFIEENTGNNTMSAYRRNKQRCL